MTQRLLFYTLFFTALISSWLVWQVIFNGQSESSGNPKNPDAFVSNLSVTIMNTDGNPLYQFFTPHLLHYSINDRSTFASPALTMFENNQPPWQAHADSGEALNGNDVVKVWGNVNLSQKAGNKNTSTVITTTAATIYPKQRIVSTDQPIKAVQPNAQMQGVGMKMDMIKQTLNLLSQVHGYYAPQKQ